MGFSRENISVWKEVYYKNYFMHLWRLRVPASVSISRTRKARGVVQSESKGLRSGGADGLRLGVPVVWVLVWVWRPGARSTDVQGQRRLSPSGRESTSPPLPFHSSHGPCGLDGPQHWCRWCLSSGYRVRWDSLPDTPPGRTQKWSVTGCREIP